MNVLFVSFYNELGDTIVGSFLDCVYMDSMVNFMRSQELAFVIDVSPKNESWSRPKLQRVLSFIKFRNF